MRQSRQGRAASRPPQDAVALRNVEVTRTYLALDTPDQLRPSAREVTGARFNLLAPCPLTTYRRLYRDVGDSWYWHDRLRWTDDELETYLDLPSIAVWEAIVDSESAGFFELARHADGNVEIIYFGLMPPFIGRGLGGMMLTRAAREGFALKASRVWLHTCTLDSPHALPAYRARGFAPFKRERYEVDIEGGRIVAQRPPIVVNL